MKISQKIKYTALVLLITVFITGTAKAQQLSDDVLKKNQQPISNSLSYITQLEPLTFEFDQSRSKQLGLPAGKQFGFNADAFKKVLPGMVSNSNKWYTAGKGNQRAFTVNQVELEKLVPLLVSAIKEQQAQIDQLRSELQQLNKAR